ILSNKEDFKKTDTNHAFSPIFNPAQRCHICRLIKKKIPFIWQGICLFCFHFIHDKRSKNHENSKNITGRCGFFCYWVIECPRVLYWTEAGHLSREHHREWRWLFFRK